MIIFCCSSLCNSSGVSIHFEGAVCNDRVALFISNSGALIHFGERGFVMILFLIVSVQKHYIVFFYYICNASAYACF